MHYDVVIVGAGPAGSTAARFLSEQGAKFLLVDKHTVPRKKPCAGGVQTGIKMYIISWIVTDVVIALGVFFFITPLYHLIAFL